MARRTFKALVRQLQIDKERDGRYQALRVPWPKLDSAVSNFVDWHIFLLWVRVATATQAAIPSAVAAALRERCPGFGLSFVRGQMESMSTLWRFLEEWIAENVFAEPRQDQWFDAVMQYAYSDLRMEQAWTIWHQYRDKVTLQQPSMIPALEQWRNEIFACRALITSGSEKDIAVSQLSNVSLERLEATTSDVIEQRGRALWLHSLRESELPERDAVFRDALRRSYPHLTASEASLLRAIRPDERHIWASARAERWNDLLRYCVRHSSRYHRLVHYWRKSREDNFDGHHWPKRSFNDWLRAADQYVLTLD